MGESVVLRNLGSRQSMDPSCSGPWTTHLSLLWSALPDPDEFRARLPRQPPEDGDHLMKVAWWTPLVHLARFGLGLAHPGAGLAELMCDSGDGSDATERAKRLIELWWGSSLDDFIAWGTGGGDQWLLTGGPWPLDLPDSVPLPPRGSDKFRRLRDTPAWQATWGGGYDPLHLADHSAHPLSPSEPVHVAAVDDRLVLQSQGYGGWYRALANLSYLAPPEGSQVTVNIRGFGELGTYLVGTGRLPRLHTLPALPRAHRRPRNAELHLDDRRSANRTQGTSVVSDRPSTVVALGVARCPEVDAARAQDSHPCRPIVALQRSAPDEFQVPEAWAGNIQDGRIVFLSSNPSISEAGDHQSGEVAEMYPTADWADEDIADFIEHRFDSHQGWATKEGKFRRMDGSLSPKPVAFWNNVRRRAGELLEKEASPAVDYAMTEVVHCKSKGEAGVAKAAATCVDRHLDSVMGISPAKLVVVLGRRSRLLLSGLWPLGPDFGTQNGDGWRERDNMTLVEVGGHQRLVVYLWHPTGATAPKTFNGAYPMHLESLRALVRGDIGPADV